jgi:IgA Peptidase M64
MKRPAVLLLLAGLVCGSPTAAAQDPFSGAGPGGEDKAETDESTPAYLKALELQRKGKWKEAQKAFNEVLKKYPNTVHAQDIEYRGGENCYLGAVKFWDGGPPSRRIDVSMMGDGFQIEAAQQKEEEEWAKKYADMLCMEASYREYKRYFNFYYVRLASKDQRVDPVYSDADLKKMEEDNKRKAKKKKPVDYSTALDCKAAGPQNQVLADRDLVYQWLEYANREVQGCGDDGLVFAFARFGALGMGGGGIANVGPPDASVDIHEFGHAFAELLDEYANNPGPPGYPIRAFNATSDPKDVPWQHFLDKKVKGVGVYEGGATYQKGVYRPANGCSMNSAGNSGGYCPVCREQAVLHIYRYVNPIDAISQNPQMEMKVIDGDASKITITPMRPMTHDLKCDWHVQRVPDSEGGPIRAADGATSDGGPSLPEMGGFTNGMRGMGRDGAAYDYPPIAPISDLGFIEKGGKEGGIKFVFPTGKLGRGRYVITCRVWDPCEWVLKDPQHLLEERETFWVTVSPAPSKK